MQIISFVVSILLDKKGHFQFKNYRSIVVIVYDSELYLHDDKLIKIFLIFFILNLKFEQLRSKLTQY